MTQSRGAFLALVLVTLLFWQTQRRKLRALLLVALFGGVAAAVAPSGVWDRVAELSKEGTEADSSSQARWEVWQIASAISADNRLFGVGYGAYRFAHHEFTSGYGTNWLSAGYKDAHSTYMGVLAEAGWPGLLLFFLMVGLPLRQAYRTRQRLESSSAGNETIAVVTLSVVGFLAAGVFASYHHLTVLYLKPALLTVLCAIHGVGSAHNPRVRSVLQRGRLRCGRVADDPARREALS
jgi:putative inorganic carbon (hco3(-)) transporter